MAESQEDWIPQIDREFLTEKGFQFRLFRNGADTHVVLSDFAIPEAYVPRTANLMIILPAGYPNARPDMFWTSLDVKLANGKCPDRADTHAVYDGINWQRWSRHFP